MRKTVEVYGLNVRKAGQENPKLWGTLFATTEMARQQAEAIEAIASALEEDIQISMESFELACEEDCCGTHGKSTKARKVLEYSPEFEAWWKEQSPKKRKDDVYALYCTIREEMLQEVPSWDFYEAWNLWLQGRVPTPNCPVIELVQAFKEDVLSAGSSVS